MCAQAISSLILFILVAFIFLFRMRAHPIIPNPNHGDFLSSSGWPCLICYPGRIVMMSKRSLWRSHSNGTTERSTKCNVELRFWLIDYAESTLWRCAESRQRERDRKSAKGIDKGCFTFEDYANRRRSIDGIHIPSAWQIVHKNASAVKNLNFSHLNLVMNESHQLTVPIHPVRLIYSCIWMLRHFH